MGLWNTLWSADTSNAAATTQVLMQWFDGAGNIVDGSDATPTSGTSGTALLPANTAFVLSWRLAQRYRGGHPRTYIAGCSQGMQNDAATWKSTVVADIQTKANTFLAAVNALTPSGFTSVTLGVLRQFANGGSETHPPTFLTPPVFHAFTSVIAKPGIATQRRRLGNNLN